MIGAHLIVSKICYVIGDGILKMLGQLAKVNRTFSVI